MFCPQDSPRRHDDRPGDAAGAAAAAARRPDARGGRDPLSIRSRTVFTIQDSGLVTLGKRPVARAWHVQPAYRLGVRHGDADRRRQEGRRAGRSSSSPRTRSTSRSRRRSPRRSAAARRPSSARPSTGGEQDSTPVKFAAPVTTAFDGTYRGSGPLVIKIRGGIVEVASQSLFLSSTRGSGNMTRQFSLPDGIPAIVGRNGTVKVHGDNGPDEVRFEATFKRNGTRQGLPLALVLPARPVEQRRQAHERSVPRRLELDGEARLAAGRLPSGYRLATATASPSPHEHSHAGHRNDPQRRRHRSRCTGRSTRSRRSRSSGVFQFRASNRWLDGAHNRSTIKGFYGAGQEDDSRAEAFTVDAGEPAVLLGTDTGPNPAESLLHALAACLTTTLVYVAAARKVRLTEVESTLEGDMDVRGCLGLDDEVPQRLHQIRVTLHASRATRRRRSCARSSSARRRAPRSSTWSRNGVPVASRSESGSADVSSPDRPHDEPGRRAWSRSPRRSRTELADAARRAHDRERDATRTRASTRCTRARLLRRADPGRASAGSASTSVARRASSPPAASRAATRRSRSA